MDTLYALQSILLGLLGWAATGMVVMGTSRLTLTDRRVMLVCNWLLWMIFAFGTLVYRGLMTTSTAAIYCGVSTVALGLVVIASARRTRAHR